ncbi:hypothetical protein KKD03_01445 [Patescibacteria group bacterium]|nr:hypothetical protein [Patescibacteria group bacterium]
MNNNLINVDYLKQVYYKSLLPLDKINEFLAIFENKYADDATKILISIMNIAIASTLLDNFENQEDKKQFLRLCQDDYHNPKILDFLIDKFPDSQQNILESIERSLLSAKKFIVES